MNIDQDNIQPAPDAREQFDRQAAAYASSVPHATSQSLDILKEWASECRYSLALDIATGPGFTAFAIAPFSDTVIASDIAEGMIEQARSIAQQRRLSNIQFQIIDAHKIPYPEQSIDLITCRTAPHHFEDIPLFLQEVQRTLKTDGILILVDTATSENETSAQWHQRVEALRDPTHATALSPSQWQKAISDARLRITRTAQTSVTLTFNDWVDRSATPTPTARRLKQDFATAPDQIAREYRIEPIQNGSDFSFSWPVFVCMAQKLG